MTHNLNRLVETVQMKGRIMFCAELTKTIPNYHQILPLIKSSVCKLDKHSESDNKLQSSCDRQYGSESAKQVIRHFVERHFVYRAISSKRLFVEVSFCRMSTSSKQVFVEYSRRNILCSLGGHSVSADPVTMYHVIVRLRTLAKITGIRLTISFC